MPILIRLILGCLFILGTVHVQAREIYVVTIKMKGDKNLHLIHFFPKGTSGETDGHFYIVPYNDGAGEWTVDAGFITEYQKFTTSTSKKDASNYGPFIPVKENTVESDYKHYKDIIKILSKNDNATSKVDEFKDVNYWIGEEIELTEGNIAQAHIGLYTFFYYMKSDLVVLIYARMGSAKEILSGLNQEYKEIVKNATTQEQQAVRVKWKSAGPLVKTMQVLQLPDKAFGSSSIIATRDTIKLNIDLVNTPTQLTPNILKVQIPQLFSRIGLEWDKYLSGFLIPFIILIGVIVKNRFSSRSEKSSQNPPSRTGRREERVDSPSAVAQSPGTVDMRHPIEKHLSDIKNEVARLHNTIGNVNAKNTQKPSDKVGDNLGARLAELNTLLLTMKDQLEDANMHSVESYKLIETFMKNVQSLPGGDTEPAVSLSDEESRKLRAYRQTLNEHDIILEQIETYLSAQKTRFQKERMEKFRQLIDQADVFLHGKKTSISERDTANPIRKIMDYMVSQINTAESRMTPADLIHRMDQVTSENYLRSQIRIFIGIVDDDIAAGNGEKDRLDQACMRLLEKANLEHIMPQKNDQFNPRMHESQETVENAGVEYGRIVRVLRRGLQVKGKSDIIKKAEVVVAR